LVDAKVARLSRGLAASAVLCAVALTARRACAQDLHPTLLAYKAPADCPPVGDFQRSVERRSARIHFVDEGSHDRELSIVLHKDADYTIGELRLIEPNGTLRQRSVRFTTCVEAVEGLALIATVSLDPQALLEAPKSVPEKPAEAAKPVIRPRPVERTVAPRVAPPEDSSGLETKVGVEFNTYFGALPKPAIGGTVLMDIGSGSRHVFAPLIRGAITHVERLGLPVESPSEPQTSAEANFALTLVSLSACPLRIGGNVVVFRPCAVVSGGALRASGTDPRDPQARTRPYWSWGGAGMLSVRLGQLLEIVGDAGVGMPLLRDTFTFGDCVGSRASCTFWKTTPLYISSGLGLSLLLP
jgi:hypothetical protein